MSTDEAYASFLDKANERPAPPSRQASTFSNDAKLSEHVLSSESDEPWRRFKSEDTSQVKDAAAFAKLVKKDGTAREVSIDDYKSYDDVIALVQQMGEGAGEVKVVEVEQGTRVYVYMVVYHASHGRYEGAQSMKIET